MYIGTSPPTSRSTAPQGPRIRATPAALRHLEEALRQPGRSRRIPQEKGILLPPPIKSGASSRLPLAPASSPGWGPAPVAFATPTRAGNRKNRAGRMAFWGGIADNFTNHGKAGSTLTPPAPASSIARPPFEGGAAAPRGTSPRPGGPCPPRLRPPRQSATARRASAPTTARRSSPPSRAYPAATGYPPAAS